MSSRIADVHRFVYERRIDPHSSAGGCGWRGSAHLRFRARNLVPSNPEKKFSHLARRSGKMVVAGDGFSSGFIAGERLTTAGHSTDGGQGERSVGKLRQSQLWFVWEETVIVNSIPEEAKFDWNDSAETRRVLGAIELGDTSDLGQLLQRYRNWLRVFVGQRLDTHLAARVDASDIVQETLLEVHERLSDYMTRRPMSFRSWIIKSAMDRLSKVRRTHKAACRNVSREASQDSDLPATIPTVDCKFSEPIDQLIRMEVVYNVRAVLANMSDQDREVIVLRNVEGLEIREIASILGISEQAARKRHGRALVRLHQEWIQSGFDFTE